MEAILAVGYRVNSGQVQVTSKRIWATNTLKEFILKGFYLMIPASSKVRILVRII